MIPRVINKPAAVILLWEVDELTGCVPGGKSRFIGLRTKEKGGKYFRGELANCRLADWQIAAPRSLCNAPYFWIVASLSPEV